jgi:hypothetical protein
MRKTMQTMKKIEKIKQEKNLFYQKKNKKKQ